MPDVINKETGLPETLAPSLVQEAVLSGKYAADPEATYTMRTPSGETVGVPGTAFDVSVGQGFTLEGAGETAAKLQEQGADERFGGTVRGLKEALSRGASGGLSDVAARRMGQDPEGLRRRREDLGAAGTVAEIGGSLLTGGAGAEALAARAAGKGLVGLGVRGVVEGGLIGFQEHVTQVSLSDDPVTLERAASGLSSRMLLGGGIGAGARLGARAVEKGLKASRKLASRAAERMRKVSDIPEDIARMDAPQIKAAKEAELGAIGEARKVEQHAIVGEVGEHAKGFRGANSPFLVLDGKPAREYVRATASVEKAFGNKAGMARRPARVMDALERQAQIYDDAIAAGGDDVIAKLAAEDVRAAQKLRKLIGAAEDGATIPISGKTAKRWGDLTSKGARKAELSVDDAKRLVAALDDGTLNARRTAAFENLTELRRQNQGLQDRILALDSKATSARLTSLEAAKEALSAPRSLKSRLVDKAATGGGLAMVTGVVGGGPLGMMAAMAAPELIEAGKKVVARMLKANGKTAGRTGSAVSSFLGTAAKKAGKKAAPAVIPTAVRTLESVAFGPAASKAAGSEAVTTAATTALIRAFQARSSELQSQVAPDETGQLKMTRAARQTVADNLEGLRAVDPLAADQVEQVTARRVEFLATKVPKRPGWDAMQVGPDNWRPSNMLVRQFARYVAAVEDPGGVEERLAHGAVTPEDAEAYKTVYPERFADLVRQLAEQLPEVRESLPYQRRLALSIFTGMAIDPAFDPRVLRVLQGQFAAEEGTEGGTEPVKAQAQFGSISKSLPEPTPAQRREA